MQLKIMTWCHRIEGQWQLPRTHRTAFYRSLIYVFWVSWAVVFHSVPLAFCLKWWRWIFYRKRDTLTGISKHPIIMQTWDTDAMILYNTIKHHLWLLQLRLDQPFLHLISVGDKSTMEYMDPEHRAQRLFNKHLFSTSYYRPSGIKEK